MTNTKFKHRQQYNWRDWESYFEKLPITENDTILDIGCGTGEIALALSKRAKHVIGVDNNMDVINHANDNNKSKLHTFWYRFEHDKSHIFGKEVCQWVYEKPDQRRRGANI